MLILDTREVLDYSLCNQTVTRYRNGDRQVLEGVYWDGKYRRTAVNGAREEAVEFLLILPGDGDIRPGDRIVAGIGPETDKAADKQLVATVRSVSPKYWNGAICHVEARG